MATQVKLEQVITLDEYEAYDAIDKIYFMPRGYSANVAQSGSYTPETFERSLTYSAVLIIDKSTKKVIKSRRF